METAQDAGDTGNDGGFDMDKGVADLGAAVFGPESDTDAGATTTTTDAAVTPPATDAAAPPATDAAAVDPTAAPPTPRAAPKAWPKDKHEIWGKLTPDAQDYLELREKQMLDGIDQYKENAKYGASLRDVIGPYMPIIQAAGLEPATAVQNLLTAQYRLTHGSMDERRDAYRKLGTSLGLAPPARAPANGAANGADATAAEPPQADPALRSELDGVKSRLDAADQAAAQQRFAQTSAEVNNFWKEHPMAEECADDIVAYITAGFSLKDAYDRAVMANPVTRAKEIDRLNKEAAEAKAKKQREEVERAQRATAANVNATASRKAPTAPVGTDMAETMTATLREIRSRSN